MTVAIRVLLIDDDEGILAVSKEFLNLLNKNMKITTAFRYDNASDLINSNQYDVIVADYILNDNKTGMDLLKEIRASGNKIPYILFTGKSREEVAIEALNNGATFYLQKGIEAKSQYAELTNMIKQAFFKRKAELDLIESEERYRRLFESARDGVFLISPEDGKIFDSNPYMMELTGYSLEDLIGKHLWELGFIKDKIIAQESFSELLDKKFVRYLNIPLQHKNGQILNVEFISNVYTAGNKQIIQCNIRDNSERFLAEQLLKTSEEKYRLIFQASPDSISLTRLDSGVIMSANDAFLRTFGVAMEDLGHQSIISFYKNPKDREKLIEDLCEVSVENRELEFSTNKGEIVGSMNASIVMINGTEYIINTIRDITEKKRLEKELIASEEEYRGLFEQALEGIAVHEIILDENGVAIDYRFLNTNPMFAKLTGLKDVIGKTVKGLLPGLEPSWLEHYSRVVETGVPEHFEDYTETLDKMFEIIVFKNAPGQFTTNVSDITEKQQALESINEANKKLNLLSSITRHDIKNQISTIEGYLSLMEIKNPETIKNEYIQKIEKSVRNVSTMIQFTKEYENIGVNNPTWQEVTKLIKVASGNLSLEGIKLTNDIPEELEIYADPLTIKVFFNLMHNAITHGLIIKNIHFYATEMDNKQVIICEDDGVGIATDMKEQLFTKAFGYGHGFGLFLSREILDITGIEIKEIGTRGGKFVMSFPKNGIRKVKI